MKKWTPLLETRSPDHPVLVIDVLQPLLKKEKRGERIADQKNWALYCNDRLWKDWKKKIRARSKMVFVDRKAEARPLAVVFEDKSLIILNKPEGLPTQKTLKSFEANLYDQVRHHYILMKDFPSGLPYVGLHHRLDRDTSGLVLMTKQRSANKEVADLFKDHKIEKKYLAYAEWGDGQMPSSWRQEDLIARGSTKKKKFFFEVSDQGDHAVTEFKRLEHKEGEWFLVHCSPKTGRTHQIRVQLRSKGYPILGDVVYGDKSRAKRMMLHAHSLEFVFEGKKVEVKAEPGWDSPE